MRYINTITNTITNNNIIKKYIYNIFIIKNTKSNIKLGRWNLKHDQEICNNYIEKYYAEPGYKNTYK